MIPSGVARKISYRIGQQKTRVAFPKYFKDFNPHKTQNSKLRLVLYIESSIYSGVNEIDTGEAGNMQRTIFADDPVKGQVKVGVLDLETGKLIKQVNRAKHYFRLIKGYAIQNEVYDQLKKHNATGIEIDETDTGQKLYAGLSVWEAHGGIWNGMNGKQRTLSEKYFTKVG